MTFVSSKQLQSLTRTLVYLLIFFLPLFFLPFTLDPLEFNKQTLLLVLTFVAALSWFGSMLLDRRIELKRGLINVLPFFLISAVFFPALYSVAPYVSWVGSHRQEYTSVLTVVACALLFYIMANVFTQRSAHRVAHAVWSLSTFLTGIIGVCSLFGVFLFPFDFAHIKGFNTVGTLSSLTIYLTVTTIFLCAVWMSHRKGDSIMHDGALGFFERFLMGGVFFLTFFFQLVICDSRLWVVFIAGLVILLTLRCFRIQDFSNRIRLWWPFFFLAVSFIFWLGFPKLLPVEIPLEVLPSHASSSVIIQRTFEMYSSSYGSGPGTYLFDHNQFRGLDLNKTFWNVHFDRASSHIMTLIPTVGILGMFFLAIFVLFLFVRSFHQVVYPKTRAQWLESFIHSCPWFTLLVSAALAPWDMTLTVSFFLFSGFLASQVIQETKVSTSRSTPVLSFMISFLFFLCVVFFFSGLFFTVQRYAADVAFTKAIRLDREKGTLEDIVISLERAATLNRFHDAYYRSLAEALLLRVNEQIGTVDSVNSLNSESSQYIQSLIVACVNATVRATELSPSQVLNWVSRGSIYRELIPLMSDATDFALSAYQKAVQLEPQNPEYWTQLGMTYLVAASHVQPLLGSQDQSLAAQSQQTYQQFVLGAESSFIEAIKRKVDYAPAHFQLALTYQRQNRLDDAIGKMESVTTYNPLDVGVHFQLALLYLNRAGEGDLERAQKSLEYTIQLAPSYSNAHWYLASIYEHQDKMAQAVKEIEVVLSLNPDNPVVQVRLE